MKLDKKHRPMGLLLAAGIPEEVAALAEKSFVSFEANVINHVECDETTYKHLTVSFVAGFIAGFVKGKKGARKEMVVSSEN